MALTMKRRNNEEWWSALWDSGAVAVGVLGPARTYVEVNPALCHLLEADAQTIIAWPYERVGHPLDLDAELDAHVRLATGAATVVYHRRFRTAREREFSAEVRLCAGPDDQVLQLVIPAEKPPAQGAEQLAQRLGQIASALSHDALEAVRRASVQSGLLAELYGEKLDERARRLVSTIEESALKAGRQLRALAAFARLGTPRIDPAPIPLRPMITAAWEAQSGIPDDVTFTVDLANDLRWRCDADQVSQALRSLLANAIDFRHPERALAITVRVSADEHACSFSVQDNGQGIAKIDQARLFRVFATVGNRAGVGLGLATVQAVAAGHDGQTSLVSEVGHGTEVSFTLKR